MSKKCKIKVCKFSAKDAAIIEEAMELRDELKDENRRLKKALEIIKKIKQHEIDSLKYRGKPVFEIIEKALKGGEE